MQRMRRLSSVALLTVLAVLGAGALTGCRSDPAVAAYVGDRQLTQSSVDDLEAELADAVDEVAEGTSERFDHASLRRLILSSMVVEEVGAKIAEDRRVAVPKADPSAAAELFGLTSNPALAEAFTTTRFATLISTAITTLGALAGDVEPVTPSEADQRELYDTLVLNGGGQLPAFDRVRSVFDRQNIGRELRVRELFSEELKDRHVTVNPRYAPLGFQIPVSFGEAYGYVVMPIAAR